MFQLKDYQKGACRSTVNAIEEGIDGQMFRKLLLLAATGSGKTVMAAFLMWYMVKKKRQQCLMLADTDELCDQTIDKVHKATGIIPDLEKASNRASKEAPIVVGSIQSMCRRFDGWRPNHFGLIIADEAHLSTADNWQRTLGHFLTAPTTYLVGVTATPGRTDNRPLMKFYDHVVAEIPMRLLMERKELSPIVVQQVPTHIKISGEISGEDNENISQELEPYLDAIIDGIEKYGADRRKILVFHSSIAQSIHFTSLLRQRGHNAAHVDGQSPDRKETIELFHQSKIRILNNVQLLTKGFDCEDIDCIIPLRFTKSRSAYIQIIGRGTRLFCPHGCRDWCDHSDRKKDCLLLDYLFDFAEKDVMGPADLFTEDKEQVREIREKIEKGEKQDLLGLTVEVSQEREKMLLERLRKAANRRARRLDAREFAAAMHTPELIEYEPMAEWETKPVTPAQSRILEGMGVEADCRGLASKIVQVWMKRMDGKLASPKQVKALIGAGVENAHLIGFDDASQMLDEIYKSYRDRRKPASV